MKKETTAPLLEVKDLKMYFQTKHKGQNGNVVVKAVDDVSFSVYPGETFGLVGESGRGKRPPARLFCAYSIPQMAR